MCSYYVHIPHAYIGKPANSTISSEIKPLKMYVFYIVIIHNIIIHSYVRIVYT